MSSPDGVLANGAGDESPDPRRFYGNIFNGRPELFMPIHKSGLQGASPLLLSA